MIHNQYSSPLFDKTKDLIWAVDHYFCLVYANKAYLNLMKEVTGKAKKLDETVFVEEFGDGYVEKWKGYYERGLNGEQFEIEEHFYNPKTNQIEYSQIAFNPIVDENQVVVNIACLSRDITSFIKSNTEAEILMDASLDVICSIDALGTFTKVSAACKELWGYEKHELIGKAFIDFVFEEDIEKTNQVATDITEGKLITTFENRYKRKDGGIAFNVWSARWDPKSQIMFCVARDAREKIKKEELLIESEQRFKALVQEGADMISIIDAAGNYIYTSPTTTAILGITPEALDGKSIFDFIHPDDIERSSIYMQRISTENKVIVEPFRFRDGNNEWRWIETVLTNMLDNPAVGGIVANSRDITENVNMLKNVEANEQFNKTIIESSPDCLKILDKEGRLLYMNFNGLCQMEIDDFSEFKSKQWWQLWGPENEAMVKESVDKALMGETVSFTAFCPTGKGTPKWWDVTVSPVSVVGEPIQQIISISRDVTAKKVEEQRLKLLESVITNTNDSVLITEVEPLDEPGPRIIYVNEAFTRMTGYTAEEVVGKSPRILQGPKTDKAELAKLSKALRNWEPCEITTINYKKNGEEFWINLSVSPVADETGWYTHWIALERDVTEQKIKELENELVAKISSTFNLVNDFEKTTKKLCEIIGLYGKFDWVELWTPNMEMTQMRLISHHVITPEDEFFYTYNDIKFSKNEGLIGKVWASGKLILLDDVTKSKEFIRADSAKKIGLKSVLGIPLIFNNEVLGVLTVGVKSNSGHLKNYNRIFERLEKFIGSELQRKTLEIELGLLFDTIPDIISVGDFQGRFLRINKPGCELLGYSEKEILQKGFEEFIHPEDLNICYKEIQQLQNGQDSFGFEVRFITKSGEILWLSWYCKAKIKEGLIYCTAKNITEEKNLRELNRLVGELAKIGSWEVDVVNQTTFWSDEVHQIYGTDPSSFVPNVEAAIKFYREDFRELALSSFENCIVTQEPYTFEGVIVNSSMKEVWVRTTGKAEFMDGGCTRVYGSFQDIHERKEAEIRLQTLSDNLPGVVFQYIIYPDGTDGLLHVSDGAELIWGFSAEEATNNNQQIWKQLKKGGDFEAHKKSIEISIETKSLWKNKWKYVMPNNEIRTHLGYGSPTFLADGIIVFDSVILDITEEAKNEELLKQTSIIARIGSWEVDVINNSIFWSDITHEIHETPKNFKPKLSEGINFYREDFRELVTEAVHACIETGKPFDFEAIIVTNKNNEVWVRVMGRAERVDGKCTRIYGSFQDIHDRKSVEQQKSSLLSTLEKSLNEIYVFNARTLKFSYVNQCALINLGYSEEEVKALTPLDLKPEFSASEFNQLLNPLVTKEKEKIIFFTNHKRKNGSLYPVEIHLQFVVEGNNERFLAVILDITERKKAEETILQANERFEKVTEATNDVIWDWDIESGTFFRSNAIDNFFGIGTSMVMKKKDFWKDKFHKEDISRIKNSLEEALEDPDCKRWEEEYRILKNDNEIIYVIDRGLILRNKNGKAIRMVGAMSDITEIKHQEIKLLAINQKLNIQTKELQRSNEELEQFAFITSHDLQEPLRMISSFMDQLKRKYSDRLDEKGLQYIYYATDGAKRMKQIILDLLLYSRANKTTEQKELINLNEIVSEYTQLRRKVIAEKSATVTCQGLPTIETYRAPISQIFHCLLDNALKYVDENKRPSIEIVAIEKEKFWQFAITDNGIGIDKRFFDKIFIIFQRLHNRKENDGNGIGLAVAKRSIEFLGGEIWVESEIDKGSTFYFTISKIKQLT